MTYLGGSAPVDTHISHLDDSLKVFISLGPSEQLACHFFCVLEVIFEQSICRLLLGARRDSHVRDSQLVLGFANGVQEDLLILRMLRIQDPWPQIVIKVALRGTCNLSRKSCVPGLSTAVLKFDWRLTLKPSIP